MAAASFHDVVQAATAGHVDKLGELLDALPALPYLRWDCRIYGFSPLMEASYYGRVDAATVLLDRGFRINDLDASGQSALMHAALAGQTPVIKLLLARGACAHIRNIDGLSATMCAAANGHLDALAALLAHERQAAAAHAAACGGAGASSWQFDAKGRGLLHIAAEFGRANVVANLLARGGDDTALDNEGRSPLECARVWGHRACVALLEDAQRAHRLHKARRLLDLAAAEEQLQGPGGTVFGGCGSSPPSLSRPSFLLAARGGGAGGKGEGGEEGALLPRVGVDGGTPVGAVAGLVLEDLPHELFIELMAHFAGPSVVVEPHSLDKGGI